MNTNYTSFLYGSLAILAALMLTLGLVEFAQADPPDPMHNGVMSVTQDEVFNSGWVDIGPSVTSVFTHNLGGDPAFYAVDLEFRDTGGVTYGVNHRDYGGMEANGNYVGAYWWGLTDSTIQVTRQSGDTFVDQVRLRIWQPDPPDWTSGWQAITAGEILTLTHSVGENVDDYAVGIKFQDASGGLSSVAALPVDGDLGIHQFAIGGLEDTNKFYGAAWRNLTSESIEVFRNGSDTYVDQVFVTISQPDPPTYDSGWVPVAQGTTETISHNLGGNVSTYIVRAAGRSTSHGINIYAAGGLEWNNSFFGANWENLTDDSIDIWRRPSDIYAEEVRVRIWATDFIFLPLVIKE